MTKNHCSKKKICFIYRSTLKKQKLLIFILQTFESILCFRKTLWPALVFLFFFFLRCAKQNEMLNHNRNSAQTTHSFRSKFIPFMQDPGLGWKRPLEVQSNPLPRVGALLTDPSPSIPPTTDPSAACPPWLPHPRSAWPILGNFWGDFCSFPIPLKAFPHQQHLLGQQRCCAQDSDVPHAGADRTLWYL